MQRALLLPAVIAAMIAGSTLGVMTPADAAAQITVNGSPVDVSPQPITQDGRVFVPLRGVFEQLGASVVYSDGLITATGNGRDIALQIGSTQATVNDQPQTIDVAPFIVGASTYVPLRFISEALGDSVNWDETNGIAAIDTAGGSADYYAPGTASYVDSAPPTIPDYEQPEVPAPNMIWQPGYWAWGAYGYYWVPGTWVDAPQPGYLWTPGYWQGSGIGFHWNPGYWALAVGFYGGINYGGGYFGHGYDGGRWSHDEFSYNRYVTRVNTTNITHVYEDRNVSIDRSPSRVAYNGGRYGLQVRPTAQEAAVVRDHHIGMTEQQRIHVRVAESDRRFLARVNDDRPAVLTVARPLAQTHRPAGFVPVTSADRIDALANVKRVPVAPRRSAPPARNAPVTPRTSAIRPSTVRQGPVAHAPVVHEAPVAHAPGVHEAPVAHAPVVHEAPVAHAPAVHEAPVAHAPVAHAPVAHAPAAFHEAPVAHAPAVREAPVAHVPVVHEVPPEHVAPVVHAAPVIARAPQAVRHVPAVYAAPPVRAAPVMHAPPAAPPAMRAAPAPPAMRAAQHAPPPHPAPKDERPHR